MPVWHEKTHTLVEEGKLAVVGIAQEQHPDRTVLFQQWKQMDWPVMLDSINLLGVRAVPITFLIDKHGIVRYRNPKDADLEAFLTTDYPNPAEMAKEDEWDKSAAEYQLLFGGESVLDDAIDSLGERVEANPEDAIAHFRLGVAYRKRFDSSLRQIGDFSKAIESWRKALELNPNQYIWRRRIQQYGPRLDKPYSFYDWVNEARVEIVARGEAPHTLVAEPSGAEFAYPEKHPGGPVAAEGHPDPEGNHPDPEGKIDRDSEGLVSIETTVVPSTGEEGEAYRVHLRFIPNENLKVHWTNDAGGLSVFPMAPEGGAISDTRASGKVPTEVATSEVRRFEFEVRLSEDSDLPVKMAFAAFYYVCEGMDGTCLYLRQDIPVVLP